jgi:hypothetical protein
MPQKARRPAARSRSLSEIAAAFRRKELVSRANAWTSSSRFIKGQLWWDKQSIGAGSRQGSHAFDKAIHDPFFASPVEGDGEFVAVDGHHVAIAEFLVKHAVTNVE